MTNEEVNLAMTEGDVVTTPPGTNQTQLPTNGLSEAEAGNDPGNYNMEETKYVSNFIRYANLPLTNKMIVSTVPK